MLLSLFPSYCFLVYVVLLLGFTNYDQQPCKLCYFSTVLQDTTVHSRQRAVDSTPAGVEYCAFCFAPFVYVYKPYFNLYDPYSPVFQRYAFLKCRKHVYMLLHLHLHLSPRLRLTLCLYQHQHVVTTYHTRTRTITFIPVHTIIYTLFFTAIHFEATRFFCNFIILCLLCHIHSDSSVVPFQCSALFSCSPTFSFSLALTLMSALCTQSTPESPAQ